MASSAAGDAPLLDVRGLTKIFGTLKANDSLDLSIGKGEIHALLGENGAGKSTLVKMLYGSLHPTAGEIVWKGEAVKVTSPSFARSLGIGMVFQHFSLFESLTVADNIVLSLGPGHTIEQVARDAERLSEEYGLPLHASTHIGDLSVGERQRVEIVRCLLQDPELIILDEPTSVLTPQEADNLFVTLKRLRDEGRSILYISHRLEEVKAMCDRATILRHGKVVGECDPRQETAASLASMMVGSEVAEVQRQERTAQAGEALLEVCDASLPPATPFAIGLKNIAISVKAGEIAGIAGVAGNGQSELFDVVSGEVTSANDAIVMRGQAVGNLDINARRKLGAAFVPEERLGHGAVPGMTLTENLLLARHASDSVAFQRFGRLGVVWEEMVEKATKRICSDMDVRKSAENPAASALSGGNLQKFIMGRELDRQPSILVVNQPTWGVDAGAASRIRQALIDLAASGSAVLMISQDLDEIFEVADRILVMHDGTIAEAGRAGEVTREKIGLLMGGAHTERDSRETHDVGAGHAH
ncbi:ABC transporter ATP-binding protein [Salaquimonas pukyongi]|uniref:ABC transporter ATP-binding protein n=1 Tax=Salaquimonas pukyongi TaxID=2712698 RepID=UPI00096BAE5E|nr:ABC transporter ATP-binding protein [Salaquimonas pukyongi]